MIRSFILFISFILINFWFGFNYYSLRGFTFLKDTEVELNIIEDKAAGTISVYRVDMKEPILIQNAKADFRPYIHPIAAPDGKGILTEYSPGHHKHQTGLYWGFTRVNGRDYFHNPSGDYWKRVSSRVLEAAGKEAEPHDRGSPPEVRRVLRAVDREADGAVPAPRRDGRLEERIQDQGSGV